MYDKNDAFQALNMLKSRYIHIQKRIEEVKKDISNCEQSKQNWEYVKGVKKSKGIFWTGFFAVNMLWGFASIIFLGIFAGASVGFLIRTIKEQKDITQKIEVHDRYIAGKNRNLSNLEQSFKLVTKELDMLQDVVHSQKPLEEKHERIMKGMNMLPANMLKEKKEAKVETLER